MKNVTILGATGSIGKNTLKVIDLHLDKFRVFALSANTNWQEMLVLCNKYNPSYALMNDANAAIELKKNLNSNTQVLSGESDLCALAAHNETHYVMAAIVGAAGMSSTLAAAKAGKRIMLANKESLVLAGEILMSAVEKSGAELIPVDSEHSAIFQCLQNGGQGVNKIQLTASGGPFLHTPINQLHSITPDAACKHPNWSMGRKISIDSATMMNKGLEVIEAHYLFDLKPEQIDVIVHPQSIIHSLVYYRDGSVLSQLGMPDMRSAIAYAMSYPRRINSGVEQLNLTGQKLEFLAPDLTKFVCLDIALNALKQGSSTIIAMNAANEIAVSAFFDDKIGFLQIADVIKRVLDKVKSRTLTTIEEVIYYDYQARQMTLDIINTNYAK